MQTDRLLAQIDRLLKPVPDLDTILAGCCRSHTVAVVQQDGVTLEYQIFPAMPMRLGRTKHQYWETFSAVDQCWYASVLETIDMDNIDLADYHATHATHDGNRNTLANWCAFPDLYCD